MNTIMNLIQISGSTLTIIKYNSSTGTITDPLVNVTNPAPTILTVNTSAVYSRLFEVPVPNILNTTKKVTSFILLENKHPLTIVDFENLDTNSTDYSSDMDVFYSNIKDKVGTGIGSTSGGSGASILNDLTDVIISSPSTDQVLKYDGSNWVNGTGSSMSDSEIKTAYENNSNTNAFTDSEETKLGFISVTQSVDLDSIESDTVDNNAKTGITAQQASDITANNAKKSSVPSVSVTASSNVLNPNLDNNDMYAYTALAVATTINATTGTIAHGQRLIIRIKDNGTSRAITWNSIYRQIATALPTATTISKITYVGFLYNSTDSKWDCVSTFTEI